MDTNVETGITVIMGVYNPGREYLFGAVRSIIRQSFRDWEMLLYDDGSDAAHEKAVREAAALDPRIRYIKGRGNRGLAYGLNVCLRHARGKYVARMDGDDVSHPERFRKMYDFLEGHPEYQWVGCNATLIDRDGRWGSREMPEVPAARDFLKYSPYIHPSVVFRRETLRECRGYRVSRKGEDYELFMRLHAAGRRGYNLQEELFLYREDPRAARAQGLACRIEEVRIRMRGFRRLGMAVPLHIPSVFKPLLTAAVPPGALMRMKRQVRKETHVDRRYTQRPSGTV